MKIGLFPLNTVLFPGGRMPLRVFEPRYLRLVSDCLSQQQPFGICLIRKGTEVGPAARPHTVGTLAHIVDWEKREDGLLGIVVEGRERFLIREQTVGPMQLLSAEVELLDEPPALALPPEFEPLRDLLARIVEQLPLPQCEPPRYDDADWVACRLAEILPVPLKDKQQLLELSDPTQRLLRLRRLLLREPDA